MQKNEEIYPIGWFMFIIACKARYYSHKIISYTLRIHKFVKVQVALSVG